MEQKPMCLETQSALYDKQNSIVLFRDFATAAARIAHNDVTSDPISHVQSTWFYGNVTLHT